MPTAQTRRIPKGGRASEASVPSLSPDTLMTATLSLTRLSRNPPYLCVSFFFFFFFDFFRATLVAYGGSQARGRIGDVAASLSQSHSRI